MIESIAVEQPSVPISEYCSEFDSLPIPMDPLYLSGADPNSEVLASDLGFPIDGNVDFELTFDLDDFYFPSENESFIIPPASRGDASSSSPESRSSVISGDQVSADVDKYLKNGSSESGSYNRESTRDSDDRCPNRDANDEIIYPASSQDSGNGGTDAPEDMHAGSPEDRMIKVEEEGVSSVCKRKKECEDTSSESRSSKHRRSTDNGAGTTDEEEKRKARLMRNRESAQLSRQRKKHYVEELEEKVRSMHSTIAELNGKISYFMAENATLRQQLSGGTSVCPPPHPAGPAMYPPPASMPYPYPWMPCAPYMVKPQGNQVPLVPIPRLKSQKTTSASKSKKAESKKSEGRTKKVASISFLGLLLFIFLFGGLVPLLDVKYGGIREYKSKYYSERLHQHEGRVLTANGSLSIGFSKSDRTFPDKFGEQVSGRQNLKGSGTENSVPVRMDNSSEPLVASLYVPRNNKLVKIDGNLIIHSVLASEKAQASQKIAEDSHHEDTALDDQKKKKDTGLAIPRDFSPALAIHDIARKRGMRPHVYRNNNGKQKALSSGSADALKDHFRSTAANGKMQQWFREGVAGPMLSSGMCTEVFQFDTSASTPGAIVPASSATSVSKEHRENSTKLNKGKNRRILHGLSVPVSKSDYNITEDNMDNTKRERFQGNNSASSMVVSVLVDPREGDGEIDGMVAPKSLSRIFVVVLMDSVKYVTYSCMLPHSGLQLVTA